MSFEPKIYRSDDSPPRDAAPDRAPLGEPLAPVWNDADELQLPLELAALAEQLRDDALHLAHSHPADATPEHRAAAWAQVQRDAAPPVRLTRAGWWIAGTAAAAVVAVTCFVSWQWNERQNAPPVSVASVALPTAVETAAPVVVAEPIPGAEAPRSSEDATPRLIPAAFLQEVSGPELDAMLELLSEQADTELSI